MRHLVLSDDGVNLAEDAYLRLLLTSNFPESQRDQTQGLLIAKMEKDEFERVGQKDYRPSEIAAAMIKFAENRTAQVYLAGFIGFVFIWLTYKGLKPSLNRASIITACAANEFRFVQWRPAFDPTGEIRNKAATSDPATLERIFRQYRSVAHICAARVAASETLEWVHLWDEAPVVTRSWAMSSVLFQDLLEQVAETKSWNLWDIKKHYPRSLRDWPPLGLGDEMQYWVQVGHDRAVEQGLIKLMQ
jgi:hypothetical protein